MSDKCIQIWLWKDAPKKFRKLSDNGGDEDYIALVPADLLDEWIPFLHEGTSFGCCCVQEIDLKDGSRVLIGCHA